MSPVQAEPEGGAVARERGGHRAQPLEIRRYDRVEAIGVAEQKTHEVRTAYERIKTQRGFK